MESQTTNSFTSTYQNFTTLMQTTPNVTKLLPPCGQPGYCTHQIYNNCKNTILSECEECSVSLGVIMITLIILLGIGIVLGNSLIIYVGYHKCKKGKHDKTDLCKTSLAAADMITGIQLLTVVVYNFSWSITSTAQQIDNFELVSQSSWWSVLAGAILIFGFTSSVYHLFLLSLLRLYAVKFPIKYKFLTHRAVLYSLMLVWLAAVIASTLPSWFSKDLFFTYQVSLMLFYPATQMHASIYLPLCMTAFLYLAPYLLMTLCTIIAAVVIRRYQTNKKKNLGSQTRKSKHISNKEISVFVTIIIMQAAFTSAMIPVTVVVSLFFEGKLNCSNVSIPYIFAIYFSMINSLVNVFIYHYREKKFRAAAKKFLCFCSFKTSTSNQGSKSSSNQHKLTDDEHTKHSLLNHHLSHED